MLQVDYVIQPKDLQKVTQNTFYRNELKYFYIAELNHLSEKKLCLTIKRKKENNHYF